MTHSTWTRREVLRSTAALAAAAIAPQLSRAGGAEADPNAVVDIGSRRELFVDQLLVERLDGLRLELQKPQPAGVALRYDLPWEGRFAFFTTILKDGDTYRMYYRGDPDGKQPAPMCYAESGDGIRWTKPTLRLHEVGGSRENNVLMPSTGDGVMVPFLDNRPGVPAAERFKANHEIGAGLIGLASGDGIHWKPFGGGVLVPNTLKNHFDSQNVMFWSEAEKLYVLYARHMEGTKRATCRATSEDFLHWSAPTLMTYSDTGTTDPSEHLYTSQVHPYFRAPHLYVSLPGRFMYLRRVLTPQQGAALDLSAAGGGIGDVSDGVLQTSRAGSTRFDRTFLEAFVRPGLGHSHWVSRTNYPALGVVPTGAGEMSLYVQRNYGQPTSHLERLTLRTDGFSSVHAPFAGGEMRTRPLRFSGQELEINYSTGAAGGLRVELQDAAGHPVPGYALADCPEIIGDELQRVVAWKNGPDVERLAGQTVRLRFVMNDADLFSLRFRERTG